MDILIDGITRSIEAKSDESLFQTLVHNNILLNSSCGGYGACGECIVKVLEFDSTQLARPNLVEQKWLGNVFHITKERLSCQIKCNGLLKIDCTNSLRRV
jgi:ferredoxin